MNQNDLERLILANSPDLILFQDSDGLVQFATPSVERVFGRSAASLVGTSIFNLLHPDDRPFVINAMAQAMATGAMKFVNEGRALHTDGVWRWITAHCQIIPTANGEGVVGVVTVLRENEKGRTLSREVELARAVITASGDGLFEIDAVTEEVWLSPSWKAALGFQDHEVPNTVAAVLGLIVGRSGPRTIPDFLAAYFGDMRSFNRIFRLRHKQGHIVIQEGRGVVIQDDRGQTVRVIGATRDITAATTLQNDLAARDERLRQASALARIAYSVYDEASGHCVSGAEDVAALVGIAPSTLAQSGRSALAPFLITPPREDFDAALVKSRNERTSYDLEMTLMAPDGTLRYLREVGRFEYNATGVALRCVGALQDVTEARQRASELAASRDRLAVQTDELKSLARELSDARREAESANRAISQFLATMSHELRTPLNAILGFAEIIAKELLGPVGHARYKDYAGDIYASGRHLLTILNDILDLAKIEAGRLDLTVDWVVTADLLSEVARLMAGPARAKDLTLDVALKDLPPTLMMDQRAMKQVLINLVTNAVRFTPPGGRILIAGRALGPERVELSVSDTGIGIPADRLDRVFLPFEQLDNRYTREAGGTGLGLTLVRALVERHGGAVSIRSEVGKGTTVRVILPHPNDIQIA